MDAHTLSVSGNPMATVQPLSDRSKTNMIVEQTNLMETVSRHDSANASCFNFFSTAQKNLKFYACPHFSHLPFPTDTQSQPDGKGKREQSTTLCKQLPNSTYIFEILLTQKHFTRV